MGESLSSRPKALGLIPIPQTQPVLDKNISNMSNSCIQNDAKNLTVMDTSGGLGPTYSLFQTSSNQRKANNLSFQL